MVDFGFLFVVDDDDCDDDYGNGDGDDEGDFNDDDENFYWKVGGDAHKEGGESDNNHSGQMPPPIGASILPASN